MTEYNRPTGFLLALYIAITIGLIGIGVTIRYGQTEQSTNSSLIKQNGLLLRRIELLEKENKVNVEAHRERNEILHADLCRLVYEVIQSTPRLAHIEPCAPEIDPNGANHG